MASSSSSSSSPHNWKYDVFTSFHGPDVRNKFLTHLRKQFDDNGITMFDDNGIERSQIIATALKKAIKESWILIVLFSKNYASSSWCLDELLEIFECKEDIGKIVMPVFYEVDPSDVRHQTGDFGIAFGKTCARYTDVKKREWSQALTYVSNIAGEHFKIWMNEAKMIEKIAKDVFKKKSYVTPGRDFDGMVGLDEKKVLFIHNNKVLADIKWYGPGSRVIVTTENKEIFQQHGISDIYHEDFPWESEASMIFCQRPLRVLGSSLRGNSQAKWIDELPSLRNRLNGSIESILKMSFENLRKKAQSLFLYIAVFFNYEHVHHVASMLAKTNLDVRLELIILANKSFIHVDHDHESRVVMHRFLQVMARQIISRQEPWKRQILVDAREICDLLENAQGDGSIVGVAFNVAEVTDLIISASAFERMCNLVFLKVYGWRPTRERKLHIPEEMEFPSGLLLLDWDAYPKKSLPLRFCTENLVELHMVRSKLEKLWEGTKVSY